MLAILLVLAAAPIKAGDNATFLGWSADGDAVVWSSIVSSSSPKHRYFQKGGKQAEVPMARVMKLSAAERAALREEVIENPEDESETQLDDRATVITVRDLKSGTERQYLTAYEALTPQAEGPKQKRFEKLADAAAWDAWKKDVGLFVKQGLEGPRGAKVSGTVGGEAGLSWDASETVKIVLTVARGGDKASVSFEDEQFAMFVPHRSVTAWWEPSGRRVALCVNTAEAHAMRGAVPPWMEVHVLAVPPRVEVLATARLKDEGDRVAALVEKAGFAVNVVGVATKDRTATVIYADDKHQADAKALAAALPGATLDKLTWKANGELVVAVGK